MKFKPGDICSFVDHDGLYGVLKILDIVSTKDREIIYNISIYQELFEDDPNTNDVEHLHPFIGHFPIAERYFLSSEPRQILWDYVSADELSDFREWFKRWQKGRAGIFEFPISACIKHISQSLMDTSIDIFLH